MKNMKRIIAVVMAIAMIFALSATAFAVDLDTLYVTKVDTAVLADSLWTKTVTVGNPQDVTFFATNAIDTLVGTQRVTTWNYFPYVGTQADADAFVQSQVTASVIVGADKLASALEVKAQYITQHGGVNYYAARITAKVDEDATAGLVRIKVTTAGTCNQDCIFMIVVESNSSTPTYVGNIDIELHDIRSGDNLLAVVNGADVYSANSTSSVFHNVNGAAQTFATAGETIDNLLNDHTIVSANTAYGYVSSITIYDEIEEENIVYEESFNPITYDYIGWMYGILRTVSGTTYYVADSANVSSTTFELQSGDKVVWVYGSYSQIVSYFANYPSM